MLKQINIKNYALAEDVSVNFESGLNIITGETGAGKSIIIDALGLLLGNRASKEIVRTGTKRAIIEGQWDISKTNKLKPLLLRHRLDVADELFIRREVTEKGTSRALINDAVVPLSVLSEITQWLVDLHGQHQHQLLLYVDNHIQFYDDVVLSQKEKEDLRAGYETVIELRNAFADMRKKKALYAQQKQFHEYEYEELKKAFLKEGEWEELEKELKMLENAEDISRDCYSLEQIIGGEEQSVFNLIHQISRLLDNLSKYESEFSSFKTEIENSLVLFSEIQSIADRYRETISYDPLRIENLRQRYLFLKTLQKKFDKNYANLFNYFEELENELSTSDDYDDQLQKIEAEYQKGRELFGHICEQISLKRKEKTSTISSAFEEVLGQLGMQHARFQVRIWREEANGGEAFIDEKYMSANERGVDRVEFFISPNPGEDFKPLIKIASGGEISRIMLALKSILASSDRIPSLVFDEIDAGISGHVANTVGKVMKNLAEKHQIICITHLPQIAAYADHHYKVKKDVENGRTYTSVVKLTKETKIKEIADLIAGGQESEEIIKTAETLLKNAN